jgi:hypothetical protein
MPHIVITRGPNGLNADSTDLQERVLSKEEKTRIFLDEKAKIRENLTPTRVIKPEDLKLEPNHVEGMKCADCGFVAATAQGLSAHRRYQHPKAE